MHSLQDAIPYLLIAGAVVLGAAVIIWLTVSIFVMRVFRKVSRDLKL